MSREACWWLAGGWLAGWGWGRSIQAFRFVVGLEKIAMLSLSHEHSRGEHDRSKLRAAVEVGTGVI